MPSPNYSIVIPAYNERDRILPTLESVLAYAGRQGWNAEVLVVDDGSRDETAEIVTQFAARHPMVRLVRNPGNRGKGYSVRNGMLRASGEILLFSDADLASPIEESEKLFAAIAAGADIAIGSRWIRSELQTQRQPLHRQLMGRLYNLLMRIVLGLNFKDTQCGFKAFKRSTAQRIFQFQKIERWGFDPELLYLARKFGLRVVEIPVAWAHQEGARIHPVRDGMRMFGELLTVRWNAIRGQYAKPAKADGGS
ncbi:MAG TPA: dolichyl-phosphate beta-glucosyltransferase [Terriglobales bacterium]|nr:dolichyl-phosphate beta-glucosyltransferase [Terriglobales bacterium]